MIYNSDHKSYFLHLSKIVSDLEKLSFCATGARNTSTLAPDTTTFTGHHSHPIVMSDTEGDPNAGLSSDSLVLDPPPGTPSMVEDDSTAEPGSKPLLGEGLPGQLPNYWLSGGAYKAYMLSTFSKPYKSKHGLSPEESSGLVASTTCQSIVCRQKNLRSMWR